MNKIIPFTKEIKFNESIGEITSIALDDTLKFIDSYTIGGDLIVRGCHKNGDLEEDFSYPIPTGISVDSKYDTSKATISVDDFYYEIINDDTLKVKIDLILDNLFYKEKEIEPLVHDVNVDRVDNEETMIDEIGLEEEKEEAKDNKITDLFNETPLEKDYSIYRIYIITNDDTLEKVLDKYHITKEELAHYNDLDNFKPGLKLIIPSVDE